MPRNDRIRSLFCGIDHWLVPPFIPLFFLLAVPLLILPTTHLLAGPNAPYQVLLINSYRQDMTWVKDIVRAVNQELVGERGEVTLQIENMDAKRYHSRAYLDSLYQHFVEKYRQSQFDLVLATDNHAYDFLLEHRDRLFPGIPVVFSGVNAFDHRQIAGVLGITGVTELVDARSTVELALTLFPETRQIYIVNDYLKTGRAWVHEMSRQLAGLKSSVRLTYSENLTLYEQRERIAGLPDDALVLLGSYFSDRQGHHTTYEKMGADLAAASKVPVFCLLDFNIGPNVMGGKVISGFFQGQMMGRLGRWILRGEPAESIPVVERGANRYLFDFNALERWGIDSSQLPPEAMVINQPRMIYAEFRLQIWSVLLFVTLLLGIIFTLFMTMRSRRAAEVRLRENKQCFEGIFNQAFQSIGLLAPDGTVLDMNLTALQSGGVDLESVRGRFFADLPWLDHSEQARGKISAAIKSAAAGKFVRFEVTHQHQDGRLIDMDFSLKPVFNDRGEVTLLIPEARDVSELKAIYAALEASSNRLKDLVANQQFLLDNINDFIYRHDLEGNFQYVSPSVKQITGFDPHEWSGNYAEALTSSPLNRLVKDFTDQVLRTGIPHPPYEIEIWHKNGNTVRLEISERPYSKGGVIVGMIGVARDVTDRAAAEKAVRDLSRFQQTIIDNAEVWLAVYDEQGCIRIWNKTAERISGYSREEACSRRHIMSLLYPDPDYRERMLASVMPVVEGDAVLENFNTRIVCKGGDVRRMVWNIRALNETGGRMGSITIGLDVTEREEAIREVMQLRNYLQNVVDSMPSILVAVDKDCQILQWNESAERVTRWDPGTIEGRSLDQVFPGFSEDMPQIRTAIETRKANMSLRRTRPIDEEIRYEDISIYPLAGEAGGAVIRVDDITERMRIEEMMIQSEKMLSVGGLAAGMAHEINNPLAGILQNMQVMKMRLDLSLERNQHEMAASNLPLEGLRQYLDRRGIHKIMDNITQSGLRATRIVENMLSFSRKGSVDYFPQDIARLVDNTLELASNDYDLKKKFDFRGIHIVRAYQEDLPRVACEAGQIQQVILNLLKNGAHAMSQQMGSGEAPRFDVRISAKRGMVQIDIQDNGPGIPAALLKRVFEPFFTTKPVGVGTGLGLSVSYFIISENHKGTLTVDSAPGHGALFSIQLPIEHPSD